MTAPNHYTTPVFSVGNRARRALWSLVWAILFLPSPKVFFVWRSVLLRLFGARIGAGCHVYPGARIWAPWLLEMDDYSCIAEGAEVYNPGGLVLGHHAVVSQGAYLCGATHDVHSPEFTYISQKIELHPYAWVCARAIVLPGVTLGEGAVLAAGAVAPKSLEHWTIHGGNPAKLIGQRKRNPA